METLLHRVETTVQVNTMTTETTEVTVTPATARETASDWRRQLPVLTGRRVILRELRPSDAASLLTYLTADEVTRHVSAPPSTVEGFERFIAWVQREQQAGRLACYAVTLVGQDAAIGIMQARPTHAGTAECGAVIGEPFWGTGAFEEAARLVAGFAFGVLGVHRLEARVSVENDRCLQALHKIGAAQEGVLRQSLSLRGQRIDQTLCSMTIDDYQALGAGKKVTQPVIH